MSDNREKGNVLVIAMIISAGMLVAAVEVSMFVASTIRQARAIDHTLVAGYAAESGVESALYQIRKTEGFTELRPDSYTSSPTIYSIDGRDASWSFLKKNPDDQEKFSPTVKKITKSRLREQESLDIHLWTQGSSGISSRLSDFNTMTVQWKRSQCQDTSVSPWIEATALAFGISGSTSGSTIQWIEGVPGQGPTVAKQFKSSDSSTPRSITFAMPTFLPEGQSLDNKGMTLRIKPFFCSLRGAEIFFQKSDGTILAIPNYYFIRPTGTFGSISKDLQAIMPSYPGATGIFDYLLFSDEAIEKIE
ncbi:hypothetical protein HY623_03650 [Candidatus Uhrbacteria bacterium]|nr:hypothetical protein [Candidatus Uhrbacteria bacterium]